MCNDALLKSARGAMTPFLCNDKSSELFNALTLVLPGYNLAGMASYGTIGANVVSRDSSTFSNTQGIAQGEGMYLLRLSGHLAW